jgi:acyl-coenzyme A thioesterase PaaI-like protein
MSLISIDDVNTFMLDTFGATSHRCIEVGDGWAVARFDVSGSALRPGSIISGPAVFGLVDAAISFAAWTLIGIEPMLLTSEMSIRYARPARGDVLFTRGEIHSTSRRTVIGSAFAWTEDPSKPVAVAQGSFSRPPA